eukprot:SAG11_NODE_20953_length_435_cov_0.613095_2_plen_81_part_01
MIRAVDAEPKAVKLAVHASIAPALPALLACLQVYTSNAHVMQPVMDFLLAAFVTIRAQIERAFIDDTISVFMRICEGDTLV